MPIVLLPWAPTERQAGLHRRFVGEQPEPAYAPKPLVSAWRILLLNPSCLGVLAVLALGWTLERLHP